MSIRSVLGRSGLAALIATAVLSAPMFGAAPPAAAQTVGILPPQAPPGNCAPPDANEPGVNDNPVVFIDYCRAIEGVGALTLPSNWSSLSVEEQMLVVFNLERVSRGEDPIVGLSASLDANAQQAADDDTDPTAGDGIWAGGDASTLWADNSWMYQDGYGSFNQACTTPGEWGCWGHRDNILLDAPSYTITGGGGFETGLEYNTSFAFVFVPGHSGTDLVFTWAQEVPYFSAPPAEEPLAPATITTISPASGSTGGGATVTITGSDLSSTTSIDFGTMPGADIVCTSDTTCTVVAPAGVIGAVPVTATNATGTPSAASSATEFTYAAPTVSVVSGGGQSAMAGSYFRAPLVTNLDVAGIPVAGAPVTFAVTGGSGSFAGGKSSATVTTGPEGSATAPKLSAGDTPGPLTVTASTPGAIAPATYSLSVKPPEANVGVSLWTSVPTVEPASSFQIGVQASNLGPAPAGPSLLTVEVSSGVVVITGDQASQDGRLLRWAVPKLRVGGSAPRAFTVRVRPLTIYQERVGGTELTFVAKVISVTEDPDPANNSQALRVRVG